MIDRSDRLVAALFVVVAGATVGMIADLWLLVYYAIPLITYLFVLMGSLSVDDRWSPRGFVLASTFGGVLLALFLWAGVTLESTTFVGGLPLPTAIMVFGIWPFATVVAPLLYAWTFQTWLRRDLTSA